MFKVLVETLEKVVNYVKFVKTPERRLDFEQVTVCWVAICIQNFCAATLTIRKWKTL